MGSQVEVMFLLEYGVMNETKGSPADERAIAPGTWFLLCCLVVESVGRGSMKLVSEVIDSA